MPIHLDGFTGNVGQLQRLLQPLGGHQAHHDGIAVHHHKRRDHHGQHHGGQDRIEQFGRQQGVFRPQGEQHKAELPGLPQIQSGAQRHPGRCAQGARKGRRQCQLEQGRDQHQQQHQAPVLQHQSPVKQHADADEKQAQEHIVEGADIGFHLVLEFGLGNQHAGNKGAQCQAQAGLLRQPGQAQRDEQQIQHKQLFALAPGHQGQPAPHHMLATHQQHGHQQGGLQGRQSECADQVLRRGTECWHQHQQGHQGQILKQQHAHDAFAVFRLHFQPLRHQLDHNRGAAHGQRARQRQCALPVHVPQIGQPVVEQHHGNRAQQHGQQHLQRTQTEHMLAHAAQLGQVELQPDHKHQEHHAKLAQVLHRLHAL